MPRLPGHPKVDAELVSAYMAQGYSVVLNHMQHRVPRIEALAAALEDATGHTCNVNLYHTPAGRVALAEHYDATEVFVLQLSGVKEWSLYDPPVILPRDTEPRLDADALRRLSDPPMREYLRKPMVLSAGDVLYLPRGWAHAVSNKASALR
jgi:lysine-specific demethylase/histidyl-hydroxylase NO66